MEPTVGSDCLNMDWRQGEVVLRKIRELLQEDGMDIKGTNKTKLMSMRRPNIEEKKKKLNLSLELSG